MKLQTHAVSGYPRGTKMEFRIKITRQEENERLYKLAELTPSKREEIILLATTQDVGLRAFLMFNDFNNDCRYFEMASDESETPDHLIWFVVLESRKAKKASKEVLDLGDLDADELTELAKELDLIGGNFH